MKMNHSLISSKSKSGALRSSKPVSKSNRRSSITVNAFFAKKPLVQEPPPPPPQKSLFSFSKKAAAPVPPAPTLKKSLFSFNSKKTATISSSSSASAKKANRKKTSGFSSVISALDFVETASKSDAELLYEAKYGELKDGKMSKEQYAALRRRVGGSAKGFFKTWVEVKGEYTDKGYVSEESTNVPALPFLVGVTLALLGATVYIVSQT
jgi:hypothetical protein